MDDIVTLVKQANQIENVIADTHPVQGHGRYLRARGHDSLVIDTHNQSYHWNSMGEHGDVINWVMARTGTDFKGAVEVLCQRTGMAMPAWGREDAEKRIAARARQDAFGVAAGVFARWLMVDPEALTYAHGRGWSDETIAAARLGYCGMPDQRKKLAEELRGELGAHGVEGDSVAAVALCGYNGNVKRWALDHDINLEDVPQNWIDNGWIPGVVGQDSLVYPHVQAAQVRYYSLRGIHEKRHYNLPECLVGKRQPYLNWVWTSRENAVVLVEGQADAITLGQWGIAALAMAGTVLEPGDIAEMIAGNNVKYIGTDADQAGLVVLGLENSVRGENARKRLLGSVGPMARLMRWNQVPGYEQWLDGDEVKPVKDANDLLKAFNASGIDGEAQKATVHELTANTMTYVEAIASWAGALRGAARDDGMRIALSVMAQLDSITLAQKRSVIAKMLKLSVRDMDHMLKRMKEETQVQNKPGDFVYTLGGMISEHLVEYVYDQDEDKALLAWRAPDGTVSIGEGLDIGGVRYLPEMPSKPIKDGVVLFASDLGQVTDTRELIAMIELFIRSNYLFDSPRTVKIISYYVLLTWVYDCFSTLPYLRAIGEAGSGKSELMKRVGHLCYRMMTASGANTAASFFRGVEKYRGTVFIDEADLNDGGDMANDIVKFLNQGAMKGNPIWRLEERTNQEGGKSFELATYTTFCPKLIAMRRDFKDDAVGSRSLTFKLLPREAIELKQAGVRLSINDEFRERARGLRNRLLRWRLEHWQPEIEINEDDIDFDISSRLNQVTLPLLAIAKDDPDLKLEIRQVLRDLYAEQILQRSMSLTARVIEAMWKIYKYPDLRKAHVQVAPNGLETILIGEVARITNDLIDEMNSTGKEDDDEQGKKKRKELTPRYVGEILRNEMLLKVLPRTNKGYPVVWDEGRLVALSKRFGVDPEAIGPMQKPQNTLQGILEGSV